ncbi:hypothetical protein Lalb_Chr14g0367291 [Lupinus albus]|uniref:Uncharacterized protein n=1 Tax=Lupinus albus TaxID=3870 RepID=A0A6A4PBY8_LUPAL|nr:hypothetical protein Lalb_Chr14g0367291 [Lupinus albus]
MVMSFQFLSNYKIIILYPFFSFPFSFSLSYLQSNLLVQTFVQNNMVQSSLHPNSLPLTLFLSLDL